MYAGSYKIDNKISYREAYVVFTFYLYFGDGELLRFMVAYPSEVLRKLLRKFNHQSRVISPKVRLNKTLDTVKYDVRAELGSVELPMTAMKSLEVGDIIPLNETVDSLVKLKIGNNVQLTAQPCVHNDKLGCQIVVNELKNLPIKLIKPDEQTFKPECPIRNLDYLRNTYS